jgi:hypothetical protein
MALQAFSGSAGGVAVSRIMWLAVLASLALVPVRMGRTTVAGGTMRPATAADVECVVIAFNMLAIPDPVQQKKGLAAFFYFLGRIDGRETSFNLQDAVLAEVRRTEGKALAPTAKRCAEQIMNRGLEIQAIGAKLQAMADEEKAKSAK